MSLTTLLTRQPAAWTEADVAALAVADVVSIRQHPQTVRAVIRETRARYGGRAGVDAELIHRRGHLCATTADQADRALAWARGLLADLERGHEWV